MGKVIEVVYEDGVLKTLKKVDLREGEIVEIEIKEKRTGDRFYRALEELKKRLQRFTMLSKF